MIYYVKFTWYPGTESNRRYLIPSGLGKVPWSHRVSVNQDAGAREVVLDGSADAGAAGVGFFEGHGARDLQVELDEAAAAAAAGLEVVEAEDFGGEGGDDGFDAAEL